MTVIRQISRDDAVKESTKQLHRTPKIEAVIVSSHEQRQMVIAVRAAVYLGELGEPYQHHFDENDFCCTHVLVLVDGDPAGTVRCRWFANFARFEKMVVRKRYRQFRVLNTLVRKAWRLCRSKGYQTVCGIALPQLVPFWNRSGGAFTSGEPFDTVYGEVVPVVGHPPEFHDIEPMNIDDIGQESFERRAYAWEGSGV